MHWLSQRGFLSNGDTWGDILWLACNHTLNLVIIKSPTTKCRRTYCFCPVSYYIPEHEGSGIYCFCRVSYYYYIPEHEVSGIYCFCSVSYYVAPMKSGSDILLFFCFFVIMSPRWKSGSDILLFFCFFVIIMSPRWNREATYCYSSVSLLLFFFLFFI